MKSIGNQFLERIRANYKVNAYPGMNVKITKNSKTGIIESAVMGKVRVRLDNRNNAKSVFVDVDPEDLEYDLMFCTAKHENGNITVCFKDTFYELQIKQ